MVTEKTMRAVMRELGRRGGKARAANLGADRLTEIGRSGGSAAQAKRRSCDHASWRMTGERRYCAICGTRLTIPRD